MSEISVENIIRKGRPENLASRLEKEIRTYDLLDSLGIKYERADHGAAATIDDCTEIEKLLEISICKNLFLCTSNKSGFYLLMMPGEKSFKTKELSAQLGTSRLSFAPPEYMEEFLDITPGSVSILGLMNDKDKRVTLLIDRDITKEEYVGCHPCVNTSSLKIAYSDIVEKFLPAVGHTPIIVDLKGEV